MTVRRLDFEACCDYFIISGGQSEFRYPPQQAGGSSSPTPIHYGNTNRSAFGRNAANGVGDVLEFPEPFITIAIYTDHSFGGEGFELEIAPATSKTFNEVLYEVSRSR